jgi:hypothetical protein
MAALLLALALAPGAASFALVSSADGLPPLPSAGPHSCKIIMWSLEGGVSIDPSCIPDPSDWVAWANAYCEELESWAGVTIVRCPP